VGPKLVAGRGLARRRPRSLLLRALAWAAWILLAVALLLAFL
jgi:hypothetical protein